MISSFPELFGAWSEMINTAQQVQLQSYLGSSLHDLPLFPLFTLLWPGVVVKL